MTQALLAERFGLARLKKGKVHYLWQKSNPETDPESFQPVHEQLGLTPAEN